MIGKLKGTLVEIEANTGLIETASGIYYYVFLTPAIIKTKSVGEAIAIYTYLQVREDNLTLYGFETKKQYKMFELLLTVSGIGPKSAFTIVCHKEADAIFEAVGDNNVDFFATIQGVGKKTAHKILLELSQKIGKSFDLTSIVLSAEDQTVVDGLVSLGFQRHQARQAIAQLDKRLSVEDRIKAAIKLMRPQHDRTIRNP